MNPADTDADPFERDFWALIDERSRARAGAEVAAIDARIWARYGAERAVVFTDLTGFSRQMALHGPIHAYQEILQHKRILLPLVARHAGRVVEVVGDSALLIFESAAHALAAMIEAQGACQDLDRDAGRGPDDAVLLCVGIGFGRVLEVGTRRVAGPEVNAASKLGEDIATANEILLTGSARSALAPTEPAAGVRFEPHPAVVPGSPLCFRAVYQPDNALRPPNRS